MGKTSLTTAKLLAQRAVEEIVAISLGGRSEFVEFEFLDIEEVSEKRDPAYYTELTLFFTGVARRQRAQEERYRFNYHVMLRRFGVDGKKWFVTQVLSDGVEPPIQAA